MDYGLVFQKQKKRRRWKSWGRGGGGCSSNRQRNVLVGCTALAMCTENGPGTAQSKRRSEEVVMAVTTVEPRERRLQSTCKCA